MYNTEQLIWLNLIPPLHTTPRGCLEAFQEQDFQISSIPQESRLPTRDGMRSCGVTAEKNCCRRMLSPPKFYVTVEGQFHLWQTAESEKKTFQETDIDLFQVFASNIITYQCLLLSSMPTWIPISKQWTAG